LNLQPQFLEQIWDNLLSREEEKIRAAYLALDQASQDAVFQHLLNMTREDGWHPQQVSSALVALDVMGKIRRK